MEVTDADPQNKDKIKSKYVARTPVDLQRIKVEKLMQHPEKPVVIPMSNKQKNFMAAIPTFVRNVMGSSAGAGSGEFHVYRHLRRKEYARQKHIQHKSRQEELDDEYQQRLESNRINSESKTAKKRAKRQKRKLKAKNKPKGTAGEVAEPENDDSEDSEDDDEGESTEKKGKPSEEATDVQQDDEDSKDALITVSESIVVGEACAGAGQEETDVDGPLEIVPPKEGLFETVAPNSALTDGSPEDREVDCNVEVAETVAGCEERAVLTGDTEASTET